MNWLRVALACTGWFLTACALLGCVLHVADEFNGAYHKQENERSHLVRWFKINCDGDANLARVTEDAHRGLCDAIRRRGKDSSFAYALSHVTSHILMQDVAQPILAAYNQYFLLFWIVVTPLAFTAVYSVWRMWVNGPLFLIFQALAVGQGPPYQGATNKHE